MAVDKAAVLATNRRRLTFLEAICFLLLTILKRDLVVHATQGVLHGQ